MTHPTLEELCEDVAKAKCLFCHQIMINFNERSHDGWLAFGRPECDIAINQPLYCPECNITINRHGYCMFQDVECTYDQLLRMVKLKAFI